jgi:hypothetical protein
MILKLGTNAMLRGFAVRIRKYERFLPDTSVLHELPVDCHTQALKRGRHWTRPDLALLALDFELGVLASAFEDAFKKLQIIGSVSV